MIPSGIKRTVSVGYQVRHLRALHMVRVFFVMTSTSPWLTHSMSHFPTDNEYLHKTNEGHIYLHNAETKESSIYLSNSTFVGSLTCLNDSTQSSSFINSHWRASDIVLCCRELPAYVMFNTYVNSTFDLQAQVDGTDYIVSADRKFVIFESNYSKVTWLQSKKTPHHNTQTLILFISDSCWHLTHTWNASTAMATLLHCLLPYLQHGVSVSKDYLLQLCKLFS